MYVLKMDFEKFYPGGIPLTIDRKKAEQKYQNMVNNAQGRSFEDYIKAACALYSRQGRAEIDKTPEPFRVLEKLKDGIFKGRFTAPAQPDFQGTLAGGRSIVFEAKYTTTDRLKRDVLTEEQQDALERHRNRGAVSGVCAGIGNNFFFVPWAVWRDMKEHFGRKYVTAANLEPFRVRFNGAVLFLDPKYDGRSAGRIFLDYIDSERRFTDHEEAAENAESDSPGHTANGVQP